MEFCARRWFGDRDCGPFVSVLFPYVFPQYCAAAKGKSEVFIPVAASEETDRRGLAAVQRPQNPSVFQMQMLQNLPARTAGKGEN